MAASLRIALIPIGIHSKIPFYIARRNLKRLSSHFMKRIVAKVIILLLTISNMEQYPQVTGLYRLQKVMLKRYSHNLLLPLFNLVTSDSKKCFTAEVSRMITFKCMFHVKHASIDF